LSEYAGSYTVGRLGALCGISRTALLYYDSIGLLSPSGRSRSGYRLYSESDKGRLERILAFRALGLGLERIRELLDLEDSGPAAALLRRIFEINGQIAGLRSQQRAILELLEADGTLKAGKAALTALVGLGTQAGLSAMAGLGEAAGITEANYGELHAAFEANAPAEHRRLLGLLGFSAPEIEDFLAGLGRAE
jgi:MerR family transcriptional regulator, thiopeptide resistance regulator